jgi:hypothetical protein
MTTVSLVWGAPPADEPSEASAPDAVLRNTYMSQSIAEFDQVPWIFTDLLLSFGPIVNSRSS